MKHTLAQYQRTNHNERPLAFLLPGRPLSLADKGPWIQGHKHLCRSHTSLSQLYKHHSSLWEETNQKRTLKQKQGRTLGQWGHGRLVTTRVVWEQSLQGKETVKKKGHSAFRLPFLQWLPPTPLDTGPCHCPFSLWQLWNPIQACNSRSHNHGISKQDDQTVRVFCKVL